MVGDDSTSEQRILALLERVSAATDLARFERHGTRDAIPREVVDSWLAGQYDVGVRPSVGYQYIGWSLMLRGFYTYDTVTAEGARSHWGYCYIDLRDGELEYAGVRVWTAATYAGDTGTFYPLYWRSVFSRFVSAGDTQRLLFGYVLYRVIGEMQYMESWEQGQAEDASRRALRKRWELLSESERLTLKDIDNLWKEIKAIAGGRGIDKPGDFPATARDRILDCLADRAAIGRHLGVLEKLLPNEPLLAILELDIGNMDTEGRTFQGKYRGLPPVPVTGFQLYTPLTKPPRSPR